MGEAYELNVPLLRFTNMGAVLVMMYLPIGLWIGIAAQIVAPAVTAPRRKWATPALAAVALVAGVLAGRARLADIEPYRYFVTPADVAAMAWIRKNTPPDALFAINTTFWLPRAPHGTDAGYWIPYFTARRTTAGALLLNEAGPAYQDKIVSLSQAEERTAEDNAALDELRRLGVSYIYIGPKGDFSQPALDAARLSQAKGVISVYKGDGVTILQLER
jgi:hypothetical protein